MKMHTKEILEKMKQDVYYYGFAHTLDNNDKRIDKYVKQYEERGFDNTELWNFDNTIYTYVLYKMLEFKICNEDHPEMLNIDTIISGFQLLNSHDIFTPTESQNNKMDAGLDMFVKQCELYRSYDNALYKMYSSILSFIVPRFKVFREILAGYPFGLEEDEWALMLDKMVLAFDLLNSNGNPSDSQKQDIKIGLDLFKTHCGSLWD